MHIAMWRFLAGMRKGWSKCIGTRSSLQEYQRKSIQKSCAGPVTCYFEVFESILVILFWKTSARLPQTNMAFPGLQKLCEDDRNAFRFQLGTTCPIFFIQTAATHKKIALLVTPTPLSPSYPEGTSMCNLLRTCGMCAAALQVLCSRGMVANTWPPECVEGGWTLERM